MFYSNYSAISHRNHVFQQMTLFWPSKVTKGQTGCTIRFASYELLYMFYSNYSAISDRNHVFQQMTLFWPFKVTKGQTDYTIRFAAYEFLYMFYSNYSAISHRNHVFSRWPCCDLPRSPKVKLVAPFDSQHMIPYTCSIVTIALSRIETMFFSRWPCSDLSKSRKVKLVAPSDSHLMSSYTCSIVTIALARTETMFSADDLSLTFECQPRSNWFHHPIRIIWVPIHVL